MHILIAPNAFKNSLSAADAALAIEEGFKISKHNYTTTCFPIADGGDGTGALIIDKCNGVLINEEVSDPLGRKIKAPFGLIDGGKTAVIEMADTSGLKLLTKEELDPMRASSAGTGELMKYALDRGVDKILLAMGGSATVDGGCGLLSALGVRFYDDQDRLLKAQPAELARLARLDTSDLDERLTGCGIVVLCDVDNALLGPKGSAAMFGPQKGATAEDMVKLDGFLSRLDEVCRHQFGKSMSALKYGGTAGGAAAGVGTVLNAKLVNGIGHFLQVTGFENELLQADLVITGEGSIDEQTLHGKGPFGVAKLAREHNIPVIGLAGSVPLQPEAELAEYFEVLLAIGNQPVDLKKAFEDTKANLIRTSKAIGDLLFTGKF